MMFARNGGSGEGLNEKEADAVDSSFDGISVFGRQRFVRAGSRVVTKKQSKGERVADEGELLPRT